VVSADRDLQQEAIANSLTLTAAREALHGTSAQASLATLSRLRQGKGNGRPYKKRGRKPIPLVFELAVLGDLIAGCVDEPAANDESSTYVVRANAVYSYSMIRKAMETVRETRFAAKLQEKDLPKAWLQLRKTKFSKCYIHGWLQRMRLSRRRVCRTVKEQPDNKIVQERMERIQKRLVADEYLPDEIASADETAMVTNTSVHYKFEFAGQEPSMANNDDKQRATLMLFSLADGTTGPIMYIVKCSTPRLDQSRTSVLENLKK